jgi:hypothetical protein
MEISGVPAPPSETRFRRLCGDGRFRPKEGPSPARRGGESGYVGKSGKLGSDESATQTGLDGGFGGTPGGEAVSLSSCMASCGRPRAHDPPIDQADRHDYLEPLEHLAPCGHQASRAFPSIPASGGLGAGGRWNPAAALSIGGGDFDKIGPPPKCPPGAAMDGRPSMAAGGGRGGAPASPPGALGGLFAGLAATGGSCEILSTPPPSWRAAGAGHIGSLQERDARSWMAGPSPSKMEGPGERRWTN